MAGAITSLLPRIPATDYLWTVLEYRRRFGRFPALRKPTRFSEKLLRLKQSADGRSARRMRISDKEFLKDFVFETLGPNYTPRTIAVLRSKQEILDFEFPSACVIKGTHTSGDVIVKWNDREAVNRERIISWLDVRYYEVAREPNYRRLQPKVIVEELLHEDGESIPRDYKVFCFHGRPAFVQVDSSRFSGHRRDFYSVAWRPLAFGMNYPSLGKAIPRPPDLKRLLGASRTLAAGFSFVRVDFYQLADGLRVGEITNFPEAGFTHFVPTTVDCLVGRLFDEPELDVETLVGVVNSESTEA